MDEMILFIIVIIPAVLGLVLLLLPKNSVKSKNVLLLFGFSVNFLFNIFIFGKDLTFTKLWLKNISFSLRIYPFSAFILICAALLSLFTAVYTVSFSKNKTYDKTLFYSGMLFMLAMTNGAVLAANLLVMLFFWEAVLASIFMMIAAGGKNAYKTAVKAVVIAAATDLCMMLGIAMTARIAGTYNMENLHLPIDSFGIPAFLLLITGAVSKAGAMPFHTWIPNAADDAPMPFMAFLPGALEKLLGIYLLVRISFDIFKLEPDSGVSFMLMGLGAAIIVCAVMMALIQKNYKRLLSYHAVSQVGFMILGIGTAVPAGIIGGIFHMLNNSVYKCGLFYTAGAVEDQTGTSDLAQLGGLGKKMPVTFACFIIMAASIAGFPMTNGFFSKELIFEAALERGTVFYIFAAVGAFFTPVSFLKLGHAVFLGKPGAKTGNVKEAPLPMLVPAIILSVFCLILGAGNSFISKNYLAPITGISYTGTHTNWLLTGISAALLILAFIDHMRGYKKTGCSLMAADHYHSAPILRTVYNLAEKHYFDPYFTAGFFIRGFAGISLKINDAINWFYDTFIPYLTHISTYIVKKAHNGSPSRYIVWILFGVFIIFAAFKFL